jgi:hypothetical protein
LVLGELKTTPSNTSLLFSKSPACVIGLAPLFEILTFFLNTDRFSVFEAVSLEKL